MTMLYVIAKKCSDGSVDIFKPSEKPMTPANKWLNIKKESSHIIDYRHKYIMLNCYKYNVMWDKR